MFKEMPLIPVSKVVDRKKKKRSQGGGKGTRVPD
jgi:hypothetical protein